MERMKEYINKIPKIKICGIRNLSDVQIMNQEKPNYAGFVFYEKSKRNVSIEGAKELLKSLDGSIQRVAVIVSPTLPELEIISELGFDILQIHGKLEDSVLIHTKLPIWRAVNVDDQKQLELELERMQAVSGKKIEGILIDGAHYGAGVTFDWITSSEMILDKLCDKLLILAGGLNEENIKTGIEMFHPDIVDVSSGVEAGEGKDEEKVHGFIRKVKSMEKKTYYGEFGGQYVAESLMNTLEELDLAYEKAIKDPDFIREYEYYLKQYVGRETPLYFAPRLSEFSGTKIYLKREDLNHTGAHKINNVIGQVLLAKRMGKTKVIAETGAGQHGVATATGAALFNMECTVYMGEEDIRRQTLNVMRMKMLGAQVVSVRSGSNTLKDATNEAIRTWAKTAEDTFYIIGSAVGPYPYPKMVKEFQRIISKEAKRQIFEAEGKLPDVVMACVGGGSNSIGMFAEFLDESEVELVGVEAAGLGIETGKHAAALTKGEIGTLHGMRSYLLQDEDGNIQLAHSISAGLDYPGVGPEHSYLKDTKRVSYVSITDEEAMDALLLLCRLEGIIPAIESAHAVAYALKKAKSMTMDQTLILCLSGRGDKDVNTIAQYLEETKLGGSHESN